MDLLLDVAWRALLTAVFTIRLWHRVELSLTREPVALQRAWESRPTSGELPMFRATCWIMAVFWAGAIVWTWWPR